MAREYPGVERSVLSEQWGGIHYWPDKYGIQKADGREAAVPERFSYGRFQD